MTEPKYALPLTWDELASLQSLLSAMFDLVATFSEPELRPFTLRLYEDVKTLYGQAFEDHLNETGSLG